MALLKQVGLLTFSTIRYLHFRYVRRIENYNVLIQVVPSINLIKISQSQKEPVHYFIIVSLLMSP